MLSSLRRVWNFSEKKQKSLFRALLFSFIEGTFMMVRLYAIIIAIQTLLGECDVQTGIIGVLLAAVVCIIGTFISSYIVQTTSVEAGFGMVKDKRIVFGELLKNVHLGFFNNSSVGSINAVLTTTLSEVETAASLALINILGGFLGSFAVMIAVFIYEWRVGIITAFGILLYFGVINWQMKVSRRDAPLRHQAQNELALSAISFLQGIKVTKAFSFKSGDKKLKNAIKESCDKNINLAGNSMPSQIAGQLCIALFEFAIIVLALMMYYRNFFTIEKALVILVMSFMVFASVNQAGSVLSMIGMLDSALEESETLEKTEKVEYRRPQCTIGSNEITFEHVCFSYGDNEVLHDISTSIQPNSLTAIIGPSGSGKSTLCQLIPRFWDVTSGSIKIGGADIRHIENSELMQRISMVFQHVYLFEDTIFNNIRFGKPDATVHEVKEAAIKARCHDFIMALPKGYDTLVSEGGGSLSGGEKQRISIARAILKKAPIILLDEATSALDAENEHAVLEAIDELTRNKTIVMIAHRMKSVKAADHIIAIERGRIVQEGTHEELIAEGGLYARFLSDREKAEGWKVR